jgi:hypothetical protein
VIVSRFLFSRKILGAATFEFCNTIHSKADLRWILRRSEAGINRYAGTRPLNAVCKRYDRPTMQAVAKSLAQLFLVSWENQSVAPGKKR